ncbi:O-antigen ligase family protein [Pseudoalteromonas piscicida]|uniref:O-antigen ligase family protein n=1 Tax=Pseudoalteromonas piscicida TaxID=43662 RepID=UPI0030AE746E
MMSTVSWNAFYNVFNTPKWIVFDACVTFALLHFCILKKNIEIGKLGKTYIIIILVMLLSLLKAVNLVEGVNFILRFSGSIFLSYYFITFLLPKLSKNLILDSILFSSLFFSLFYIYSRIQNYDDIHYTAFSTLGFVNNLGQVLNVWLPLLIASIWEQRKNKVKLAIGSFSFFVCIFSLLESGTRGTILGLIVGELFLFLLIFKSQKEKALLYISITASIFSVGLVFSHMDNYLGGKLSNNINSVLEMNTGRETLFMNSIDMVLDNPIGVGVNNFEYIHQKYAKLGTTQSSPLVSYNTALKTPHNILLKVFSELGWFGGLLFTSIFIFIIYFAIVNAMHGGVADKLALVSVISTMFHSLFTALFLTPASLYFSVLLFSFVLYRLNLKTNTKIVTKKPKATIKSYYLTILLSLYLCFFTLYHLSNYYSYQGFISGQKEVMQKGIKLNPYNERALYDYYTLQSKLYGNVEESRLALEQFLAVYPYHAGALLASAELHHKQKNYHAALADLEFLLSFYPQSQRATTLRKSLLFATGKARE